MRCVLVHGLGQQASSWERTLSFLAYRDPVDCPDLRALLRGKAVSYAHLYQAFSDFCGRFSEPIALCGLSLGGMLALQYAIEHPDAVQALVLVGARYKTPRGLLKFQNILFRLMPERAFEKAMLQKKDLMRLTNSMAGLDFSEKLREVACATLVVCGEKDGANKKTAKALAEQIHGAKLCFVENAGHEVNVEAPEALAGVLGKFLAYSQPT